MRLIFSYPREESMQALRNVMKYYNPFYQCTAQQFEQEIEVEEFDYFGKNAPLKIEVKIFELCYQTPSDAAKLALVSKKWKKLFLSDTVWKRILENSILPVAQSWFQQFKERPYLAKECKQHLMSQQRILLELCEEINFDLAIALAEEIERKKLNTVQGIDYLNTWLNSKKFSKEYSGMDLSNQNLYEVPSQLYRMEVYRLDLSCNNLTAAPSLIRLICNGITNIDIHRNPIKGISLAEECIKLARQAMQNQRFNASIKLDQTQVDALYQNLSLEDLKIISQINKFIEIVKTR
ncbi:MAG: hypothetical protein K0S74_161 [Chlamydiales bacterium]|nr:hypothetical protein [Chlamydiales bacterium]